MIKLIFIIFLKINFVSSQSSPEENNKALTSNKTEQTEELLIRNNKDILLKAVKKETKPQEIQQPAFLQDSSQSLNITLEKNNKQEDLKTKPQITKNPPNKTEQTKALVIQNNEDTVLKSPNKKPSHQIFQSRQKMWNSIKNSSQSLNIISKDNNKYRDQKTEPKAINKIKNLSNKIENQIKNIILKTLNKQTASQEMQQTTLLRDNSQSFNIILKDNNKYRDQKKESQTANEAEKNLSIELESSFTAIKNDLTGQNYKWKYSMPYIDTNINYKFSKNTVFEISFDFSYDRKEWDSSIEEVFVKYQWLGFLPTDWILGYFKYPIFNLKQSDSHLSKKTLSEQNLFPSKDSDIGALLKTNFWKSFYLQLSLQAFTGERELLYPLNTTKSAWTASLNFKQDTQHFFASYLQQNFFSKKQQQAFGLGSHLSYPFHSLLFSFKGEIWKINHQPQNTLTYYVFPSLQWGRLALSFLFGKAHYQLGNQTSESKEYILKTDFYLTDELFVSLERIHESDSIIKNSSWVFSLKSHFNF